MAQSGPDVCQVAKLLPANVPAPRCWLVVVPATILMSFSTMQAGVEQPAHEPVPTAFMLLMRTLNPRYSEVLTRSAAFASDTAKPRTSRRCAGWFAGGMGRGPP